MNVNCVTGNRDLSDERHFYINFIALVTIIWPMNWLLDQNCGLSMSILLWQNLRCAPFKLHFLVPGCRFFPSSGGATECRRSSARGGAWLAPRSGSWEGSWPWKAWVISIHRLGAWSFFKLEETRGAKRETLTLNSGALGLFVSVLGLDLWMSGLTMWWL